MSGDTPAVTSTEAKPAGGKRDFTTMVLAYCSWTMLAMIMLGFASGLPLYMVFTKLSFWLREAGIERSTIGYFYWVSFAYSFKFIWAPVVDRIGLPWLAGLLGQRRSWMVFAIGGTILGLVLISQSDPATGLGLVIVGALVLAFSGATLDISIDAWRIESAPTDLQANMAAAYSLGYRGALIFSGLGLAISEWLSWGAAYGVMALGMLVTAGLVFLIREPAGSARRTVDERPILVRLVAMFVEPFLQFWGRFGVWLIPVLVLLAMYRLSDFTMGVMASPLYADIGFDKAVVGGVQSGPGVMATIAGLFVGGAVAVRFGVMWALIVGAVITFLTNGAYAWLAASADAGDVGRLTLAIVADNIAGGFVTTVFIAYMSGLTDSANAATQYALLAFFWSFFSKFAAGFSGTLADAVGYEAFFLLTACWALPAAGVVVYLMVCGPAGVRGKHVDGG